MARAFKLAAVLALLAAVAAAAFYAAVWMGNRKVERTVEVRVVPVAYARERDAAALRLGKYLYESRGCGECHGMDGAGRVIADDPAGTYIRTPNITRGAGGVVSAYGEGDWVRTIRHGVDPAGRALLVMPSEEYNRMNDGDFAALVAYVRSLPPANGEPASIRLPAMLKALYGIGAIRDSAEKIDHRLPPSAPVAVAESAEHGAYVAHMCIGCHGPGLSGGRIPGAPPDWPAASNLTPGEGSVMARYAGAGDFIAMMRTGKRPDGSRVSPVMPFESLSNLNDTDLKAIHAFLRTLPARKAGGR